MIKSKHKSKDFQTQTILRQSFEIEKLKEKIFDLEIDVSKKDELSEFINDICTDQLALLNELEEIKNEYGQLMSNLTEIKNIMKNVRIKRLWHKSFKE